MYRKPPKYREIDSTQFYTKCNRLGEKVIIVKGVCLYVNKSHVCEGCKLSTEGNMNKNVRKS